MTSACRLDSGPLLDSATDIDVIGSPDLARAKNVQPCVPLKYDTIAGGGVCKMRGDLSTPLVDITAAPIIESSKVSIASMSTVHDQGYTDVSDSDGMTLQKDGVAHECVPLHKYRYLLIKSALNSTYASPTLKLQTYVSYQCLTHYSSG